MYNFIMKLNKIYTEKIYYTTQVKYFQCYQVLITQMLQRANLKIMVSGIVIKLKYFLIPQEHLTIKINTKDHNY